MASRITTLRRHQPATLLAPSRAAQLALVVGSVAVAAHGAVAVVGGDSVVSLGLAPALLAALATYLGARRLGPSDSGDPAPDVVTDSGPAAAGPGILDTGPPLTLAHTEDEPNPGTTTPLQPDPATDVARCVEAALAEICDAEDQVRNVETSATEAMSQLEQVALQFEQSATSVRQLDEVTQDIDTILSSIKSIAEQTNLLALNASIEAARAGEHGKGFTVVAAEVRNLSMDSHTSADRIAALLDRLRTEVGAVVELIESGSGHAEQTVYHAMMTQMGLSTMTEAVTSIRDRTDDLVAAIDQAAPTG